MGRGWFYCATILLGKVQCVIFTANEWNGYCTPNSKYWRVLFFLPLILRLDTQVGGQIEVTQQEQLQLTISVVKSTDFGTSQYWNFLNVNFSLMSLIYLHIDRSTDRRLLWNAPVCFCVSARWRAWSDNHCRQSQSYLLSAWTHWSISSVQ